MNTDNEYYIDYLNNEFINFKDSLLKNNYYYNEVLIVFNKILPIKYNITQEELEQYQSISDYYINKCYYGGNFADKQHETKKIITKIIREYKLEKIIKI